MLPPTTIAIFEDAAARPPTLAAWERLCAALDGLPDEVVRDNLRQLDALLEGWPATLRAAPPRWIARLAGGGGEPRAMVCRKARASGSGAWPNDVQALQDPDASRVVELDLSDCGIDAAGCAVLADLLVGTGVSDVCVRGNRVGTGLAALLGPPPSGNLARVDAESCGIDNGSMAEIASAGAHIRLARLSLATNYLNARSMANLAGLSGFARLRELSLAGNKVLAAGVTALLDRGEMLDLVRLDLEGTQCGDEGVARLASGSSLVHLETLTLASCGVGDAGAVRLAESSIAQHVKDLDLRFNYISSEGAFALLASPGALETLRLYRNTIGDELVEMLDRLPAPLTLKTLLLDSEQMSDDARVELQAHPSLRDVVVDFA
jgi:hypothetical protein